MCAKAQYGLPFTGTTALSILMLNDFLYYLDQTDVSIITWAQYMEPVVNNGTGLVDLDGNARPSWHSFKFWGDLPVERVVSWGFLWESTGDWGVRQGGCVRLPLGKAGAKGRA